MTDDDFLSFLQQHEDQASQYNWGELATVREAAVQDYDRVGYLADEDKEGQSLFVSSDTHDAVETILPDMLDVAFAGDQICRFEPETEEEEDAADDASRAVNHIFRVKNNGFLLAHNVIKDALQQRNGFLHWFVVDEQKTETFNWQGTDDDLAFQWPEMEAEAKRRDEKLQIIEQEEQGGIFLLTIKRTFSEPQIKIECVPPAEVMIHRTHSSPLLHDCRYVSVLSRVTLSDLKERGFDVDEDDLGDDIGPSLSGNYGNADPLQHGKLYSAQEIDGDPSQRELWLRTEYVLADYDGDGIAERRRVYRLHGKILENEPFNQVSVACASPYLRQHRWDGYSVWDHVKEIQEYKTQILRDLADSLSLATSPRLLVQTDSKYSPVPMLEDLVDNRIGGLIRTPDMNSVREIVTTFVGQQALPFLEVVEGMKENRLGITRHNQGIDADSLNKTLGGMRMMERAAERRMKLIARIFGETLFAPMSKGVLQLLTSSKFGEIKAKVKGKYVTFDPAKWRDNYDMSVSVGLGTGDKENEVMALNNLYQLQMNTLGSGLANPKGVPVITAEHVSHTIGKIAENSGFNQPSDFVMDFDSEDAKQIEAQNAQQPPPPPPPEIQREQMRADTEKEKTMATMQADAAETDKKLAAERQQQAIDIAAKEKQDEMNNQFEAWKLQFLKEQTLEIERMRESIRSATNNQKEENEES